MLDSAGTDLSEVGAAMLRAAPSGWTQVVLNVTGAGSMIGTDLDIDLADGSTTGAVTLDLDGRIACDELRERMHQTSTGTWYNARIVLDQDRQLEAEFDNDNPPFNGDATDELLTEDQGQYPRDPQHLPAWHPSRGPAS